VLSQEQKEEADDSPADGRHGWTPLAGTIAPGPCPTGIGASSSTLTQARGLRRPASSRRVRASRRRNRVASRCEPAGR
jgi:hypothetical protein